MSDEFVPVSSPFSAISGSLNAVASELMLLTCIFLKLIAIPSLL
jgi:hypothetical protein